MEEDAEKKEEDTEERKKMSTYPDVSKIVFCVAIIMLVTFVALTTWSVVFVNSKGEYGWNLLYLPLSFLVLTVISFISVIASGINIRK